MKHTRPLTIAKASTPVNPTPTSSPFVFAVWVLSMLGFVKQYG